MKKLLILMAVMAACVAARAADPDVLITVNTTQNVRISLAPNGSLDANPIWVSAGGGSLTTTAGTASTFVTAGAGVTTITITGSSQGNPLSVKVVVTVVATPPPATTLGATAGAIAK